VTDHQSACCLQLQQESLQHATALQGLAHRADDAATQMHQLQRLMEAMQSALHPLCLGGSGAFAMLLHGAIANVTV
jgi:hypothetical protein